MTRERDGYPAVDFLGTSRSADSAQLIEVRRVQRAVIVGYQRSRAATRALEWAADEASTLGVPLLVARVGDGTKTSTA